MSKHVALFKINDDYLYREQNLIVIQVPVLFICKSDKNQLFLALLADFNDDSYIICPLLKGALRDVLRGNIEVRRPFALSNEIYTVQAGPSLEEDKVDLVSYRDIEDFLPKGSLSGIPCV